MNIYYVIFFIILWLLRLTVFFPLLTFIFNNNSTLLKYWKKINMSSEFETSKRQFEGSMENLKDILHDITVSTITSEKADLLRQATNIPINIAISIFNISLTINKIWNYFRYSTRRFRVVRNIFQNAPSI